MDSSLSVVIPDSNLASKASFFFFFSILQLEEKFQTIPVLVGMSLRFLGGICILKTSMLITWLTGMLVETWVLWHPHPRKQLLSALVTLIMRLLLNKSHSMQRYDDKWFSGHPLYCGSWGIVGNTPLALGYLGDTPRTGILELASCWDSFAHSTPLGLKLLCSWTLWALFPPNTSRFFSMWLRLLCSQSQQWAACSCMLPMSLI